MPQTKMFNETQSKKEFFAEVIESSLDQFTGQSWQWDRFPDFGSLVTVESNDYRIFGCVTSIQTGSMDPMRSPFPYQKTEEELRREQPQIFEFLQTTFNVQILGHQAKDSLEILYMLPSKPCKIHAFVKESSQKACAQFFDSPDFMHLLFSFQNKTTNVDELLLAILHQQAQRGMLTTRKLNNYCQRFSLLSGNDYRRLKLFLQRIKQVLPTL